MGLLDRLFGSSDVAAEDAQKEDTEFLNVWEAYLQTVAPKKSAFERGDFTETRRLLTTELADLHVEVRDDAALLRDLNRIEHDKRLHRIERIDYALNYETTRHKYLAQLLKELLRVLLAQMQIVQHLIIEVAKREAFSAHFTKQGELESVIIGKIQHKRMSSFPNLFPTIMKGGRIIRRMNASERRLFNHMKGGMHQILSNELSEGITFQWTLAVFNGLQDCIDQEIAKGTFPGYSPDIDFEFVNRPEFLSFAKEKLLEVRERPVSDRTLQVFVYTFRTWFTFVREQVPA
ncbi:MAG: hypothetical protein Q7S65_01295 [Nanoarchaeota archaeon]|nr:hypothetical protein [Nanoarchaeota archaeon]